MEDVALGLAAARVGVETVALPGTILHLGTLGAEIDSVTRVQLLDSARIKFAKFRHGPIFAAFLRLLRRCLQKRKVRKDPPRPVAATAS